MVGASFCQIFCFTEITSRARVTSDMEKEVEKLTNQLQEERTTLEKVQNQQAEDSRGVSKQQKNTERYLAKKQMLMNRKEECNRNIRDLGVLPEEAFEKYTNEKLDRVRTWIEPFPPLQQTQAPFFSARQETSHGQ